MLFQPPMCHQNKGEGVVFILLFLCIFVCIICAHYVCLYFIYLYLRIHSLFIFFGKKGILFAHTPETDAIFNHF